MNVLLISPKDPKNPSNLKFLMGGENTYTQSLLAHPPKGVSYTHFSDALAQGEIEYTKWQTIFSILIKIRFLPPDVGYQCIRLKKKFDIIHCHGYCLKIDGKIHPKVVLSDSSSNYLFLKDYLGWDGRRIDIIYTFRKWIAGKLNVFDPNLHLNGAPLVVWSNFARKVHQDLGQDSQDIIVIPPGIEQLKGQSRLKRDRIVDKNRCTILFVGIWFKRKGGNLLLSAYKKLKKKYPHISLTIIGEIPESLKLPKEVFHKNYLPRETLTKQIFPKANILVDVPPVAEGYGLIVVEAASLAVPSIVSRVYALPEIVDDNKTGLVITPGSVDALTHVLEILIKDSKLRKKMGQAARRKFKTHFSIDITNKKLLKVYQDAIEKFKA